MTATRRRWSDLSWRDRRAVLLLAAAIPALHLAVRACGFRRTHALQSWWGPRAPAGQVPDAVMTRWTLATARVQAHSPLPGNCLSRSLALWWILHRGGVRATLHLGVSLGTHGFASHAWVDVDGRVLNDTQDVSERYTPLYAV